MLDGTLSGIGSFRRRDAVGNVPVKSTMLRAARFGDGEIRFAGKLRLHFDEINAFPDERVNVVNSLFAICDDKRRLKRWRIAVEIGPSKDDARPDSLPFINFFAKRNQVVEVAAHVANGSDSVRKEKRNKKIAASSRFPGAG